MQKIATVIIILLAGAVPLVWADVELVRNGKPMAEIILSATATPSVKVAALELQRNLELMSGAKLPIVSAPSVDVENQVYVGASAATEKLGVSIDDINYDGFKIVTGKNYLILAGREFYHSAISYSKYKDVDKKNLQKDWEEYTGHKWRIPPIVDYRDYNEGFLPLDGTGTLYSIYELLGQLGMRWYAPVPDLGVVMPKLKNISIKEQSLTRSPQFPVRVMTDGGNGRYRNEFLWYKSMGAGEAIDMPIYHSLSGPLKISPKEQPQEYYGMVNGKVDYNIPKLTNEKLRAATVEYLEWVDKAFPGIPYASIGQPDGWSAMDSADSDAGWDKIATRGAAGRFSDYAWDFILDVRKRYKALHPNRKFTVFAYAGTTLVPKNVEKIPDDITVVFCETSQNWMLPEPRQDIANRKDWMDKLGNKDQLLIWEYYILHSPPYNFPPVPIIFTKMMKKNFEQLYDKCAGFTAEVGWSMENQKEANHLVLPNPWLSHLMLYLHARLCWDRNLDLQAVLNEYYNLFYGPAHAEMKEFFEFAESVWTRPEARQITAAGGFLKPEDVIHYFEILARAKEKAGDTIYGKRIDLITAEMEPLKILFKKLERIGPNIQITASKEAPVIDGDLNKPFWHESPYFFMPLRDMLTGAKVDHAETHVAFRWLDDNSALIVGIECMEPKMANLKEGCKDPDSQSIFLDDNVEVRLETAKGFRPFIVVNPAGIVLDECVTNNVADLPGFYKVTKVAVKKYADRWTVELRIDAAPISGERPTPYFPWGVNICRQRMAGTVPEYFMLSPSGSNFKDMKYMANIYLRR